MYLDVFDTLAECLLSGHLACPPSFCKPVRGVGRLERLVGGGIVGRAWSVSTPNMWKSARTNVPMSIGSAKCSSPKKWLFKYWVCPRPLVLRSLLVTPSLAWSWKIQLRCFISELFLAHSCSMWGWSPWIHIYISTRVWSLTVVGQGLGVCMQCF